MLLELLPYIERKLQAIYDTRDPIAFGRKCLINVASAGKFSSDRTIRQYAQETWFIEPVPQRRRRSCSERPPRPGRAETAA